MAPKGEKDPQTQTTEATPAPEAAAATPAEQPAETLPGGVEGVLQQLAETQALVAQLLSQRQESPVAEREAAKRWAQMEAEDALAELQGTVSTGPEPEGEDLLDHEIIFRSADRALNLVRRSRNRVTMANGEASISAGIHYTFQQSGREGEFRTRSKSAADWIRSRPGFNVVYWEVGKEPFGAQSPEAVLRKIMDAVARLDIDALDSIEHEERAGSKRPVVLAAISGAKDTLRQGAAA
jgi:hypothetical protein